MASDLESRIGIPTGNLLRVSTAGSVDDGKSTLVGRLLHDTKNIYEDHLKAIEKISLREANTGELALAYITDGLRAEREQGITIDVAYRYFSTPKRRIILADTPGHEQYTRNMATGASTANLAIILVDARNGVITQTKRHAFISSLLGVPRIVVAVNKMDLVDFSEAAYREVQKSFTAFAGKLGIQDVRFIPVSALHGDNIVSRSTRMPWFQGETLLEYMENVYTAGDLNLVDFRFPVQYVLRGPGEYRGYAGQLASGSIKIGEEVMILPSMRRTRVVSIDAWRGSEAPLTSAIAPMSVALTLEHQIDIARGDMIVRTGNVPQLQTQFEAMVVWMNETPMDPTKHYLVMHTTRLAKCSIDGVRYKVDINTLSREQSSALQLNEVGRVALTSATPLPLDSYRKNRSTGNFVLIDPITFATVGAGMVLDRLPEQFLQNEQEHTKGKNHLATTDLHHEEALVSPADREKSYGFRALTIWCTGLSGSGKSSIAKGLERRLFDRHQPVYCIDGDNLRFGLNRDLGFSKEHRRENIRRAAEVARLFNQAGVSVICSFISPYQSDREAARVIIGAERFVEVYVATPLAVCEARDPHGLYRKARTGEIAGFTGVSSPYEAPTTPAVTVDTSSEEIALTIETIDRVIRERSRTGE